MGIDISGGMFVGAHYSDICIDVDEEGNEIHDLGDYLVCDLDMDSFSPWYDAGSDECYFGFKVDDVLVKDIDNFVITIKELAKKFEELTGTQAKLIGMQNVW